MAERLYFGHARIEPWSRLAEGDNTHDGQTVFARHEYFHLVFLQTTLEEVFQHPYYFLRLVFSDLKKTLNIL